jgi:hypothetical protein
MKFLNPQTTQLLMYLKDKLVSPYRQQANHVLSKVHIKINVIKSKNETYAKHTLT